MALFVDNLTATLSPIEKYGKIEECRPNKKTAGENSVSLLAFIAIGKW